MVCTPVSRCYNTDMEKLSVIERSKQLLVALGATTLLLTGCANTESLAPQPSSAIETTVDNAEQYASHDNITASVFWIGEPADGSNDFITNVPTAWDEDASVRFGG